MSTSVPTCAKTCWREFAQLRSARGPVAKQRFLFHNSAVSPISPNSQTAPVTADPERTEELKVFISSRESVCDECHENLGSGAWITLAGEKGALCLECADLDHLAFLPAGNTALTRRARQYSSLSVVVLKWSRARKRYERQGLLVQEEAIKQAEAECMADGDRRAAQREREKVRREGLDREYVDQFAAAVRTHFPKCPPEREREIAEHACQKYSGRIGRSASAKSFDEQAVRLAIIAHIRHWETNYDELLMRGFDRRDAREVVSGRISAVLLSWHG